MCLHSRMKDPELSQQYFAVELMILLRVINDLMRKRVTDL